MRISIILATDDEVLKAMRQCAAAFPRHAREHVLDADASKAPRGFRGVDLDADLAQGGGSDAREKGFGIDQNPVAIEDQESHGGMTVRAISRFGLAGRENCLTGRGFAPGESEFPKGSFPSDDALHKGALESHRPSRGSVQLRLDLFEAF